MLKKLFGSHEASVKDPFSSQEETIKNPPIIAGEGSVLDPNIKVSRHGKYLMYTAKQF